MKITLIYDNTVHKEGLSADWGFACLIEMEGCPKILFDTGANGKILLSNMKALDIDPSSIEEVMISHNHWDHTGGLSDILKANNTIKLYVPASFPDVSGAKEVVRVDNSLEIHDGVFSTGELSNIEQSLIIKTKKGLAVIAGCSHSGVTNILDAAS
ncbi:MAG: MBL fold metallo-hydrolase, partial [Thermodesulfobacteriota bacterium]|nr:MBL fold metallo-hydrolase [Thermodesulfobacteriota bacterium]